MVSRTYAEYKGEIYKWNELLDKLNLSNDGYSSGRIQFYNQASSKQLENIRCMIKDDDGEYVEICNVCEELIENCVCEKCEECGELIDNCKCERCEECEELIKDCNCDRCGKCGGLINEYCIDMCECERCKECDELIDDCECEKSDDDSDKRDPNSPIPKNKGRIIVKSNPSNLCVYLYDNSDTYACYTPDLFDIKPGTYKLEAFVNDDKEHIKKVTVYKSQVTNVMFDIIPEAKISKEELFSSRHEQNHIKREREEREKIEQENLDKVREENRKRLEEQEKLKQSSNANGKINIESNPNNVNISIYNNKYSYSEDNVITPISFDVVPGIYEISLSNKDYNAFNTQIQVSKFETKNIKCDLKLINDTNIQNNDVQTSNGNEDYVTSNGKKAITRAQLPSGEIITWVELLKRRNLSHRGGSAYVNWLSYKSKDVEGRLPDVKRVDFNGYCVSEKEPRKVVSQTKRSEIWMTHFGNVMKTICPCCKNVYDREIRYPGCYELGHNEPHSKGGSTEFDNLIPICKECNDGMGNKYTVVEYRKILLSRKKIIER